MSLRTSLKKLIRRDPAASLRERAAELQARIAAFAGELLAHATAELAGR